MTKILAIFLIAAWLIGCVIVGLAAVLIFNINLHTFGKRQTDTEEQPKETKIQSAEDRRPDGGFSIS